ncbi:MAG: hypothetical protein HYY06_09780 [Deltaproteobacteria bacterium]|nr:hypothetical protein [Deltaproteobacteria bacterium]
MSDTDELLRFLGKLGREVMESAEEAAVEIKQAAKHVTGLGRGSVKLELDQPKAAPGDSIRGRVVLALTEPVEAKKLFVTLQARQKMVTVQRTDRGRSVGTSHVTVYELERELDGAKQYLNGTFPFELTVPADALLLRPATPSSPLGEVARTIASAVSPSAGPIEWQIVAALEIPWGRNLTGEVDIAVVG